MAVALVVLLHAKLLLLRAANQLLAGRLLLRLERRKEAGGQMEQVVQRVRRCTAAGLLLAALHGQQAQEGRLEVVGVVQMVVEQHLLCLLLLLLACGWRKQLLLRLRLRLLLLLGLLAVLHSERRSGAERRD